MKTKTKPVVDAEDKERNQKILLIGFKLKLIALLLNHHSPQSAEIEGFSGILDAFGDELRELGQDILR